MPVAPNNWSQIPAGINTSPTRFGAITPSDVADNELPEVPLWLIVGVGGTITFKPMSGADVQITLPAGMYCMRYRQIKATGTAATTLAWAA